MRQEFDIKIIWNVKHPEDWPTDKLVAALKVRLAPNDNFVIAYIKPGRVVIENDEEEPDINF